MAFTIADLVLPRCCLSERLLLLLRVCLLLLNLSLLLYTFFLFERSERSCWYCFFILFSTWSTLLSSCYFVLSVSIHVKYRTLVARHFEYHESLLDLSSDPGLETSELGTFEKWSVKFITAAFVTNTVNLFSLLMDPRLSSLSSQSSQTSQLHLSLISMVTVAVEIMWNRYTLRARAVLEMLLLGLFYCFSCWVVNWTEACNIFQLTNQTTNQTTNHDIIIKNSTHTTHDVWYSLHVFEHVGVGSRFLYVMPYFFFFGALLVTGALSWFFTAIRFQCSAKERDLSDHTSKIMMCALD